MKKVVLIFFLFFLIFISNIANGQNYQISSELDQLNFISKHSTDSHHYFNMSNEGNNTIVLYLKPRGDLCGNGCPKIRIHNEIINMPPNSSGKVSFMISSRVLTTQLGDFSIPIEIYNAKTNELIGISFVNCTIQPSGQTYGFYSTILCFTIFFVIIIVVVIFIVKRDKRVINIKKNCPKCGRNISSEFILCPYCCERLK